MIDVLAELIGRVGLAAVAGLGIGIIAGGNWWVGVGATLVIASFPECLGFHTDVVSGPDYSELAAELDSIITSSAPDDEVVS